MLPSFEELLQLAGFTLRGKNRASCAHCAGHDRSTVAFSNRHAHCFRCGWKSTYLKLARELKIIGEKITPEDRLKLKEIQQQEKRRAQFLAWQNKKLKIVLMKLTRLRIRAKFAAKRLRRDSENELLWSVLARFYHEESNLNMALDFFSMTSISNWLEQDSTPKELIALFNDETRRNR